MKARDYTREIVEAPKGARIQVEDVDDIPYVCEIAESLGRIDLKIVMGPFFFPGNE
jgi:hypothetical protein